MGIARTIILIIVVVFVLIFSLYNANAVVTVIILGKSFKTTVALLALYSFLAGIVSLIIFAISEEIGLRIKINRLKKENKELKKEINSLRNLPLGKEEE